MALSSKSRKKSNQSVHLSGCVVLGKVPGAADDLSVNIRPPPLMSSSEASAVAWVTRRRQMQNSIRHTTTCKSSSKMKTHTLQISTKRKESKSISPVKIIKPQVTNVSSTPPVRSVSSPSLRKTPSPTTPTMEEQWSSVSNPENCVALEQDQEQQQERRPVEQQQEEEQQSGDLQYSTTLTRTTPMPSEQLGLAEHSCNLEEPPMPDLVLPLVEIEFRKRMEVYKLEEEVLRLKKLYWMAKLKLSCPNY
ncbi:unnamed protein product [Calicophoron daubneyi]|uniref:Uncharacterized protein n=1 Tax=Calicophoron daubneyi TaxID=300641 RepID=A0AAV2TIH9_CALDB